MQTIEFIWRKRFSHLDSEHYYAWAEQLLLTGQESPSVIELAANPDMHWQDRDKCIIRIFEELNINPNVPDIVLYEWREKDLIRKFMQGDIDAPTLIQACFRIASDARYPEQFVIWALLSDDLDLVKYTNGTPNHLDLSDLNNSLRHILIEEKKLPNC